jgi:hypothetical protein
LLQHFVVAVSIYWPATSFGAYYHTLSGFWYLVNASHFFPYHNHLQGTPPGFVRAIPWR